MEDKCAELNNGKRMPLLGLGSSRCFGAEASNAVEVALDNGYRHIDTAHNYRNEEAVGKGIRNWLNKSETNRREDIFVVTKLPFIGMCKEGVKKFLQLSLSKLNLSYVDLYLVHSPVGMKGKNDDDVFPTTEDGQFITDHSTDLIAIWKEMEKMVDAGLAKSIGISNFNIRQMRKMIAISRIPPTVNQVELHVYFQQRKLVEFCNKNGIVVTAYGPLGSPGRNSTHLRGFPPPPSIMSNAVVQLIADRHGVTAAQVLIRFLVQQGFVAIPKSSKQDRIKSNSDVFSFVLSETEMAALRYLDKGAEGRTFNAFNLQSTKDHPEYPYLTE